MTHRRSEDLDVARRYLFDASEGLAKAGRLLARVGLTADGRSVSRMAREVEAIKARIRKAHEDALAAERGNGGNRFGRWS